MTVGEARAEFSDPDLGKALPAWGDSPEVPRDPDDYWCWVFEEGIEIRTRFKTIEEACEGAWCTLWWAHENWGSEEEQHQILKDKIEVLQKRGCGFPEKYKTARRSILGRKKGKS